MNRTLDVTQRVVLLGLGRYKALLSLSEKRITKAVREALRGQFPGARVWVSCTAEIERGEWRGTCGIEGTAYDYWIKKDFEEMIAELKAKH